VSQQLDRRRAQVSGGVEPAQLVKFAVVGRIRLRRHGQGAAAVERHRAVEQQVVDHQRHADRAQQVPVLGRAGDLLERGQGAAQQRVLKEEIAAGIAAQAELGAEGVMSAGAIGGLELFEMRGGVEHRVGDARHRHTHRDPRKPVRAYIEEVLFRLACHAGIVPVQAKKPNGVAPASVPVGGRSPPRRVVCGGSCGRASRGNTPPWRLDRHVLIRLRTKRDAPAGTAGGAAAI
jgi:hypothetical protein